jgi:sugar/nucleoside kinase (ribokinase family)
LAPVLAVIGDLLEDIVVRVGSPPALGTDTPAHIERRRGGSAANVAACAARAGAMVRFIGCVGEDELGEWLVSDLTAEGVEVRVQRRGRTGSVVVLVGPDGERTMLPDRAAATELADVDTAWLDGVGWLHVPSYSLLSEPIGATVRGLIVAVRGTGGRLSIDVSSISVVRGYGVERYGELLAALEPDVVFANDSESALLPGEPSTLTVVKNGPRPVRVRGCPEAFEVDVPPLPGVTDSTGAGDAFAAGYLVSATRGESVRDSVTSAIERAAQHLYRQRYRGPSP